MNTQIRKIDPVQPEKGILEEAAAIIKGGGVVAFPTETVYGLGADALQPEGAQKIYEAKGRPSDNPLIVHIAEWEAAEKLAADIPPEAKALASAFWPGPLTMILPKSDLVPYETTGGLETVAIRMPSHPVAHALIRESGRYIAAPSANQSGRPSPTRAEHVKTDLAGRIPLILDGGPVGIGIESTIVDLTGEAPEILRPGFVTEAMLSEVIGSVRGEPARTATDRASHPRAPGMKYRHYAPEAEMTLVHGARQAVVNRINALAAENRANGLRTGVLCTAETAAQYKADAVKNLGSRSDEAGIAQHLYALLREFDAEHIDVIYSECFSDLALGTALMNRLEKAAGHRLLEA